MVLLGGCSAKPGAVLELIRVLACMPLRQRAQPQLNNFVDTCIFRHHLLSVQKTWLE